MYLTADFTIVSNLVAERPINAKNHRKPELTLAFRAIVCASSGQEDAHDGRITLPAGQSGTHIDAMLQLKESTYAVRIHIV